MTRALLPEESITPCCPIIIAATLVLGEARLRAEGAQGTVGSNAGGWLLFESESSLSG